MTITKAMAMAMAMGTATERKTSSSTTASCAHFSRTTNARVNQLIEAGAWTMNRRNGEPAAAISAKPSGRALPTSKQNGKLAARECEAPPIKPPFPRRQTC